MATQSDKGGAARKPRVNLKDLKKLIDMMRKAELSEVNIEQEGIKIALKRGGEAQVSYAPQSLAPAMAPALPSWPQPGAAQGPAPAAPSPAAPSPAAPAEDGQPIHSPMVGTFYRAGSPDAAPYVELGSKVEVGQTVCIIEAMKLMNEIKAESAGTITKIHVENAQPVEFGQTLFSIKP